LEKKELKATWLERIVEMLHYKHVTEAFTAVFRPRPNNKDCHTV